VSDTAADLPDYDDLPPASVGGRSGWFQFGDDDQIGLGNLFTPERVVAAARLVRRGVVFPLDLPIGTFDPPLNPNRMPPRHTVVRQPNLGFDDVWDSLYPQAGSQWDSLAHIGYTRQHHYNGATAEDVRTGRRDTIEHWAAQGVAGRAVVLDVESVLRAEDPDYSPGTTTPITVEHLETARTAAGVDLLPGDVLLIVTGYTRWYVEQPPEVRTALPGHVRAAGLEHSEAMCRYLWNTHAAAVASDTFAVEAWPANTDEDAQPFAFIHQMLIGSFGMALGELWRLDRLVDDCRRDGRWTGLLVSAPFQAPGGISSPANAVVIK
jgi:kynurenine formamidase